MIFEKYDKKKNKVEPFLKMVKMVLHWGLFFTSKTSQPVAVSDSLELPLEVVHRTG